MLNPKLREMFPDEGVIEALEMLAYDCEKIGIKAGISGIYNDLNADHPAFIVKYDQELPFSVFSNYCDAVHKNIDVGDEPCAPVLSTIEIVNKYYKQDIIDIWV